MYYLHLTRSKGAYRYRLSGSAYLVFYYAKSNTSPVATMHTINNYCKLLILFILYLYVVCQPFLHHWSNNIMFMAPHRSNCK